MEEESFISGKEFDTLLSNNIVKHIQDTKEQYIHQSGYILKRILNSDNTTYKAYVYKRLFIKDKSLYFMNLYHISKKKHIRKSLHKLVAQYFLKEKQYDIPGKVIKFKDNNRSNISKDNLYWEDDIKGERHTIPISDNSTVKEAQFLTDELFNRFIKKQQLIPIDNSPGFYIHERGFVVNGNNKRIMTTFPNQDGYRRVALPSKKHGVKNPRTGTLKRVNFTIHLLVAQGFLEEKSYKVEGKTINHIDGNRINNYYKNLEWITGKANVNHAHDMGLVKTNTDIIMEDIKKNEKIKFRSLRDVGRFLDCSVSGFMHHIAISKKYPLYARYKLSIVDLDRFFSNSKHNGITIHVYDYVKKEVTTLDSVLKVSAIYGLPSTMVRQFLRHEEVTYIGGYSLSYTKQLLLSKIKDIEPKVAQKDRDVLWRRLAM